MLNYILGLLTIPLFCILHAIAGLVFRTVRDTNRYFKGAKLKPGYSRWNYALIVPIQLKRDLFRQLHAFYYGYETKYTE